MLNRPFQFDASRYVRQVKYCEANRDDLRLSAAFNHLDPLGDLSCSFGAASSILREALGTLTSVAGSVVV